MLAQGTQAYFLSRFSKYLRISHSAISSDATLIKSGTTTSSVIARIRISPPTCAVYLKTQKKDIVSSVGVPERSLDYVLKQLQTEGKILYSFKRGRGGGIFIASVLAVGLSLAEMTRQVRELYYQSLSRILEQSERKVEILLEPFIKGGHEVSKPALFELDTG